MNPLVPLVGFGIIYWILSGLTVADSISKIKEHRKENHQRIMDKIDEIQRFVKRK